MRAASEREHGRRRAGTAVVPGLAVGPAWVLAAPVVVANRGISAGDVLPELVRLERSLAVVDARLGHSTSSNEEGELAVGAELLQSDRDRLAGAALAQPAREMVRAARVRAEGAVRRVLDELQAQLGPRPTDADLAEMEELELMGDLLLRTLMGMPDRGPAGPPPAGAIVVARDLHADELDALARAGVSAFVTEHGPTDPAAAGVLPHVTGVAGLVTSVHRGDTIAVNGSEGWVEIFPGPQAG